MSALTQEQDRRIRAALAATVRQGACPQDYLDCAELLSDAGLTSQADLVYRLGAIRQGSSPIASAEQRRLADRLGVAPQGEMATPAGGAMIGRADMALADLGALLVLNLPPQVEPPGAILDGLRQIAPSLPPERAPLELAGFSALVAELHDLLSRPQTPELAEALSATLERLHVEVLPFPAEEPADEELGVADLVLRTALRGLRDFLLAQYDLAYAPFGDSRILHAFANLRDAGLGAYGRNVKRWVEDGAGLRALIGLARQGGPPLTDGQEDHWCILLARPFEGPVLHRVLDDLSDAGLTYVSWGLLAGLVRRHAERPDRQVLERIRDAGLDFGDLDLALAAQRLDRLWWDEDKNEWLALGDIHAYRGDYAEAEVAFAAALQRDPGNGYAEARGRALREERYDAFLNEGGFGTPHDRRRLRAERRSSSVRPAPDLPALAWALDLGGRRDDLAPELEPRPPVRPQLGPGLHLRRLGACAKRSRWGLLPRLQGVEAIRGVYVSVAPLASASIAVEGQRLSRFEPQLASVEMEGGARKYVFNEWVDLAPFPQGRYEVELGFETVDGQVDTHLFWVLIEAPTDVAGSDASLPPVGSDTRSLEAIINARPSQVRQARRTLFATPPTSILVLRTDQLGDLVCSIPALQKLRTLFPHAHITGLVSPANEGLARTLPVFDDLIVVDLPVDPVERRRTLTTQTQIELRETLRARGFDLAIDLADNSPSRLLLPLSGASYLVGMRDRDYPFLDLGFEAHSKDPSNGSETVPATNKAVALVDWLEAALRSYGETVRRPDLSPSLLERFAVRERGFAVLHTGAQLRFSRWPHYEALTALILDRTDLDVVLMTGGQDLGDSLDPQLGADPRLRLIEQHLAFDDLDALLSYCAMFVGNDSGPKHLASLRGSPVVSLHCARNNWNEWGQENTGLIISRRVPCAGCQISTDPDECGKHFACLTHITPEEVFGAVESVLGSRTGTAGGPAPASRAG